MKIEVFGTGCKKCELSVSVAEAFLTEKGIDGEVVKHGDLDTMVDRGVLRTPTTMVDGEAIVVGRILRDADLETWISKHGVEPR